MAVKLLGFTTLDCGCVAGRYRDRDKEVVYCEEKGKNCRDPVHRRNFIIQPAAQAEPER